MSLPFGIDRQAQKWSRPAREALALWADLLVALACAATVPGASRWLPLVPLSKGLHKPVEEALREAGLIDGSGNPVGEDA